jgi:hypothetical protein
VVSPPRRPVSSQVSTFFNASSAMTQDFYHSCAGVRKENL